ncbi:hypothetical protein Hanom_Chr11g00996381 [Helianthus anomalus]
MLTLKKKLLSFSFLKTNGSNCVGPDSFIFFFLNLKFSFHNCLDEDSSIRMSNFLLNRVLTSLLLLGCLETTTKTLKITTQPSPSLSPSLFHTHTMNKP